MPQKGEKKIYKPNTTYLLRLDKFPHLNCP